MNTANHLSEDDLALFALQLLPEDEIEAALLHMRTCELCRHGVGEFQGDLALISMTSDMQAPSATARERLLQSVSNEKRSAPITAAAIPSAHANGADPVLADRRGSVLQMEPRSTARRPLNNFITWTGWAVAAAFAIAAGLQLHDRQQLLDILTKERARFSRVQESAAASQAAMSTLTDPTALNVTLRQPVLKGVEAPLTPEGHAAYLPDQGALVFIANNLQPLEPYKVYELWLLPAGKDIAPIPAGSFRPDAAGNATIILPTGPKLMAIKGFGVTREDGKSAPQKPTLPILLMGTSKS